MTDEQIARKIVDSSESCRFAIRYTNKFTNSNEPTDLGVGFLADEYRQYMSLRNAVLLYEKGHSVSEAASQEEARHHREKLIEGHGDRSHDRIDADISEFRHAGFSDRDPIKARLKSHGASAYRRLLAAALDDAEASSFRKAVIYFLIVEARYDEAVEPLFNRYMKGKNPGYLSRNDEEGFGLWREVKADLEAVGVRLESAASSHPATQNTHPPVIRERKWWQFWA